MRLSGALQKRYFAKTYEELATRVTTHVGKNNNMYRDLLLTQMFIPAGNTLLAGVEPIRPNCCILPTVSDQNLSEIAERSAVLWKSRIGIGFDLNDLIDPVAGLRMLSGINQSIRLGHRPQRGNMAVLNINHPSIVDFINAKNKDDGSLYNFNISVSMKSTDVARKPDVIDLLAHSAWKSGDPGILFLDRITYDGDFSHLGQCTTMVPCGEQSMFPNEVCTLGSMNLACPLFWSDDYVTFKKETFEQAVRMAVAFLDDVVDLMDIPDPLLKQMSLFTRRIGLGVMGFADVLRVKKIAYGDNVACMQLIELLGSSFKKSAHEASKARGSCPALASLERRNLTITCIAPTGGITPLTRNLGYGIEPIFEEAHLLDIKDHFAVQSKWQEYVCNSISKTINLRESATVQDVKNAWQLAVECGNVKSVTVYRDKSKKGQPMPVGGGGGCTSGVCM